MKPGIYRGCVDYHTIDAVNISSLLWIGKSPLHYKCRPHITTKAMSLGTAAHAATLEPERFDACFRVWGKRKSDGSMWPRRGPEWESFLALYSGATVITEEERATALEIATSVRTNEQCADVLRSGSPEVTLVWEHEPTGMLCKGRVDWLDVDRGMFADLKTAADITPGVFMSKAAKLHYHTRMAWYHDAICQLVGMESSRLETLIMVVESGKPHDCAVYWMDDEVLAVGRDEYDRMMDRLKEATEANYWPGIGGGARNRYYLPKWAIPDDEDVDGLGVDWSKQ